MTEHTYNVTADIIYYSTNIENSNHNALYLILSKNEDLSSEETAVIDIGFIHIPESYNASNSKTQVRLKTWDEVVTATNVDFLTMVNQFSEEMIEGDDMAKICAEEGDDYEEILELCKNIADSIKLGGQIPQNAGELFKAYVITEKEGKFKPTQNVLH